MRYIVTTQRDPSRFWSVVTLIVIFGLISMISTEVAVGLAVVSLALWAWWKLIQAAQRRD